LVWRGGQVGKGWEKGVEKRIWKGHRSVS
jgi:hypothetical protein